MVVRMYIGSETDAASGGGRYIKNRYVLLKTDYCLLLNEPGLYAFLEPSFRELSKVTNEMIDPYDHAIFGGDNLLILEQTIQKAIELVREQPESWDVIVEWTTRKFLWLVFQDKPVYVKADRGCYLEQLLEAHELVRKAAKDDQLIICVGD